MSVASSAAQAELADQVFNHPMRQHHPTMKHASLGCLQARHPGTLEKFLGALDGRDWSLGVVESDQMAGATT